MAEYQHEKIYWYEQYFYSINFFLVSLFINVGWVLLGCYLLIRRALEFHNNPFIWLVFIISTWLYLVGFWYKIDIDSIIMGSHIFFYSLIYILLAMESKEKNDFIYLRHLYQQNNKQKFLAQMPRWFISSLLVFILLAIFYIGILPFNDIDTEILLILSPFFLFIIRDIGIVLWINISGNTRKPDIAALLYLSVLYIMIPLILETLNLETFIMLFFPMDNAHLLLQLLFPSLEIILVYTMLYKSYRKNLHFPTYNK